MFSKRWFFDLDKQLRDAGLDSDSKSFDEILFDLQNRKILSPTEFAVAASYVILAGGFSQKTAKLKHAEIIKYLENAGKNAKIEDMLPIFNNRNKMAAILEIWQNADKFCNDYYKQSDTDSRISYLATLPHIGKITANHFARNLGENVVKYDIWIQRLGVMYKKDSALSQKIDNGNLDTDVRIACDEMFSHLESETGLPRGYIDVVLWKSCQQGLIKL